MAHPIDRLEAERREIVAALSRRITECGVPRTRLALACGLSEMALRRYDDPRWNPAPETIRKVSAYLDAFAENRNTIRSPTVDCKGRPQRPAAEAA